MGILYIDGFGGFDPADLASRWSVTNGSWSVGGTAGRGGGAGLVQGSATSRIARALDAPHFQLIVGFAFKLAATPASGAYQRLVRFVGGGLGGVEAGVAGGGQLRVFGPGGTLISTGSVVVDGSFYYMEVKVPAFSSGSAPVVLAVNGTTVGTSPNIVNTGSPCDTVELGGSDAGVTTVTYDDFYVCDPNIGTLNTGFCGPCAVDLLLPVSDGGSTHFTPTGAASNQACVADGAIPDGDATYVSSATVGDVDTYLCGSLPTDPALVFAVQFVITARKDDVGGRTLTSVIRQASTDHTHAASVIVGDSYATWLDVWQGDTGETVRWTGDGVAATEFGFKVAS